MKLLFRVHYRNGPFISYVEEEALNQDNPLLNEVKGYLTLKTRQIKLKDVLELTHVWQEEKDKG